MKLNYNNNNYFNEDDLYILYNNVNRLIITKTHLYNGNWYSDAGCQYKMTSVKSINCKEVYHSSVEYCGLKGIVCKFLSLPNNDLGVIWESGENIKKYDLPNYWQNINNVKL